MNKKLKRIFSLIMALAIAFSLIPSAFASSEYYSACSSSQGSIVDALAEVGENDTSFSHRVEIAKVNSISGYEGSASQNSQLLRLLKSGSLKTADSETANDPYSCRSYDECNSGGECYTVIDNSSPLRSSPYQEGSVIAKLKYGTLVKVVDVFKNSRGNTWAEVEFDDGDSTGTGYIFMDHLKKHVTHSYTTLYDTEYGNLDVCLICGNAIAHVIDDKGSDFFEFDLLDVANQAVKGDYYDNSSFWGILGRVLAGDIPYFGWVFDARDFVYDATNCDGVVNCATYLTLDAAALLPVVGGLKIIARSDDLKKGIQTLPLNELPSEVQTAFKKYDQVNWAGTYKGSAPGTHAGGYFNNANKDGSIPLPSLDANGNSISYHEFDVNNKIVGNYRDKARFVRGSDGRTYITFDHYDTFVRIVDWSE